jgi:hypothetical protein
LRKSVIIFLVLLIAPITISAVKYLLGDRSVDWQIADRSSAGLLPSPPEHPEALVRVFAARTVRWRGIFAVHSWIVVKERGASRYTRYDYTAWGEPIRINGFCRRRALVRRHAGDHRRSRRRSRGTDDSQNSCRRRKL